MLTSTQSASQGLTLTPSQVQTPSMSRTLSQTATIGTRSQSPSVSPSLSQFSTVSQSSSVTATASVTGSSIPTMSPSSTRPPSPTQSRSTSPTPSPSGTGSITATLSQMGSFTASVSQISSASKTQTASGSSTPSSTASFSQSLSMTQSLSHVPTYSGTMMSSPASSGTQTVTQTVTLTVSQASSPSATRSCSQWTDRGDTVIAPDAASARSPANSVTLIAGAVAGGVLILLVVCALVLCFAAAQRSTRRKKQRAAVGLEANSLPAVSSGINPMHASRHRVVGGAGIGIAPLDTRQIRGPLPQVIPGIGINPLRQGGARPRPSGAISTPGSARGRIEKRETPSAGCWNTDPCQTAEVAASRTTVPAYHAREVRRGECMRVSAVFFRLCASRLQALASLDQSPDVTLSSPDLNAFKLNPLFRSNLPRHSVAIAHRAVAVSLEA